MKLHVSINGESKEYEIHPKTKLLDLLRDEGYSGVKRGCSSGDCGACAVIIDGKAMNTCVLFAAQVEGAQIRTIEGIGRPKDPHPVQVELTQAGAVQCGFCIPGMISSAVALLEENPEPTGAEVCEALDGNLCRCTGYVKQVDAILRAVPAVRKLQMKKSGVK